MWCLGWFLFACQPKTPPAEAPVSGAAPAEVVQPETPGPSPFVGTWSSPSCDERTYERRLEIRADGTLEVWDRVSPCPPKANCMWSGIAHGVGEWTPKGDTLRLSYTTVTPNAPYRDGLVTLLTWDGATKAPYEDGREAPCPYMPYRPGVEEDASPEPK